jgi:hypothetical protein
VAEKDWDAKLADMDRRLESVSDRELLSTPPARGQPARVDAERARRTTTFGVLARLVLAVMLGVAMLFWPYSARCGVGLAAYLGAVAMVVAAGWWTAFWTWRQRSPKGHVLSLLLILWGLVLGAVEVLPRVGYARPDAERPQIWVCE